MQRLPRQVALRFWQCICLLSAIGFIHTATVSPSSTLGAQEPLIEDPVAFARVNAILDTATEDPPEEPSTSSFEAPVPGRPVRARTAEENRLDDLLAVRVAESYSALLDTLRIAEAKIDALNPTDAEVWRKQLEWESIRQALARPELDKLELGQLAARFYGSWKGLEQEELVAVRDALQTLVNRLYVADESSRFTAYEEHMRILQAGMPYWGSPNSAAIHEVETGDFGHIGDSSNRVSAADVARSMAWIESAGLHPDIVDAYRAHNRFPNLLVSIDRAFVLEQMAGFQKTIDEEQDRNQVIAGANVSGRVHLKAEVNAELLETEEGMRVALNLTGVTEAPYNIARKGPARIYSSGRTTMEARTEVYWDGDQLQVIPTTAECWTTTQLLGARICRPRLFAFTQGGVVDSLFEGIAENQANAAKRQAEMESNRIAERELTSRMDEEAQTTLADANSQIHDQFRGPMIRTGMWCDIGLQPVDAFLAAAFRKESPGYWGAERLPELENVDAVLVLSAHESAMTAFLQRVVGGMRWEDRDFSTLQNEVVGDRSYEMRIGLHDRWSMRFDWWQPWRAEVDDSGVNLIIRGTEFTIEDKTYTFPYEIRARYQIHMTRLGPEFLRQGEVRVTPLDYASTEQGSSEIRHATEFMEGRFNGFFMPEFFMDGLTVPSGGKWGQLSGLRVVDYKLEQGWLNFIVRNVAKESLQD